MVIFYYFAFYWITIMAIGAWYAILRRKMRAHVLLPVGLTKCSLRKIDAEITKLEQNGINEPFTRYLATVKKLYIACWITIAAGPLGGIWIMAFF